MSRTKTTTISVADAPRWAAAAVLSLPVAAILICDPLHFTRFEVIKLPLAAFLVLVSGLGLLRSSAAPDPSTVTWVSPQSGARPVVELAPFLGFLLWSLLCVAWSSAPGRGVLQWGMWLLAFAFSLLVREVLASARDRTRQTLTTYTLLTWLCGGAIAAGIAICQSFAKGLTLGLHQVSSTVGNPNRLAAVLLLLVPAAVELMGHARQGIRRCGWIGGSICVAGIFVTGCHGALLGLLAMIICFVIAKAASRSRKRSPRRMLVVCGFVLLALTVVTLQQRDELARSLRGRMFIARIAVAVLHTALVRGVGAGGFPTVALPLQGALLTAQPAAAKFNQQTYPWTNLWDPHNLLLFLTDEHGLVGLALFLAAVIIPLAGAFRRRQPLSRAAAAAWIGLLILGLSDSVLLSTPVVLLAFGWLALAATPARTAGPSLRTTPRRASLGRQAARLAGPMCALGALVIGAMQAASDYSLVHALAHDDAPHAARRHLYRAVQLALASAEPLFYRSLARADDGDLAGACADMRASFAELPSPERATALGTLYLQRHDPSTAIQWFQRALQLHPRFTPAHNNLGVAYLQSGDVREAARAFAHARTLRPGDRRVLENQLGHLVSLRSAAKTVRSATN